MSQRRLLAIAGIWIVMGVGFPTRAMAQGVIFVVRHAEKGATPAADPSLSADGTQRAEALRDALKEAGVTAIFTSPAVRTKETAKPLAAALGITPKTDPMDDAKALVEKIRAVPGGGNVLVVGHSDTIPRLLKALGHSPAVSIGEAEFDNLFVVTPGEVTRPRVTRLRYRR